MRIALIGTRGVPARYGGFETCVEEVGSRLAARGHDVIVFCRPTHEGDDDQTSASYRGMRLIHLPIVRRRSIETLCHTALCVVNRGLRDTDAAIMFNAANSVFLPVLRARRIPVATHVDGLEWLRAKWGRVGRRYYRLAERLAVRWSDGIIADAQGIADYYQDEFAASSVLIAYGAPILAPGDAERLEELDLAPGKYHLVVARFEPENHVLEMIQGYQRSEAELPLVVVGSAPYADAYTAEIRATAGPRVRLLGGVWDQEQLDQLYSHALTYLHGHSVGGTNPSLLRAAGAAAFTIAYDVDFNREVIGSSGVYFSTADDVARELVAAEADPAGTIQRGLELQRAVERYNWDDVTDRYEDLARHLMHRRLRPGGSGGRRIGLASSEFRESVPTSEQV
jgi:glycosyltransferase involved in cell wall biosynthesis